MNHDAEPSAAQERFTDKAECRGKINRFLSRLHSVSAAKAIHDVEARFSHLIKIR
jgi:hypothetical protein